MSRTNIRRAALVAALVALGLVPWTGWLALTLPATATAAHWAGAWVGLDSAIAACAAGAAVLLARRHPRADLALVATASLMLLDAWFDTMTATGPDLPAALAEAGLVEVPLALAAVVLALRLGPPRRPAPAAHPAAGSRRSLLGSRP